MNLLDAVKTKNIIKISLDDSLSSALSHLSSSHDAAFIFDDKKKFVGESILIMLSFTHHIPEMRRLRTASFIHHMLKTTTVYRRLPNYLLSQSYTIYRFLMIKMSLSA